MIKRVVWIVLGVLVVGAGLSYQLAMGRIDAALHADERGAERRGPRS